MKVIKNLKNFEKLKKRSVVTIGVFDGLHIGHQKIIEKVVEKAKKLNLLSVVITFDPYPKEVLSPKTYYARLTGTKLKLHLIEKLGIDITLIIRFDKKFSQMSQSNFASKILAEKIHAACIVLGEDFRFGANGKGDIFSLTKLGQKYGFEVVAVPLIETEDNQKISSTRIRKLIKEGALKEARSFLGHRVILSGKVISGKGYGSLTGFHTSNIETKDKASIPKEGVYAGFVTVGLKKMTSVINIGPSPTFNIKKKRIEAHILSYDKILYNKEIEIELVSRIRDIKKFVDTESLSAQIKKDIIEAKRILNDTKK